MLVTFKSVQQYIGQNMFIQNITEIFHNLSATYSTSWRNLGVYV